MDGQAESVILVTGNTPGSTINEVTGVDYDALVDGNSYFITVNAIARGKMDGVQYSKTFKQKFCITKTGGTATIVATGPSEVFGSLEVEAWTLQSAISGLDVFVMSFDTGLTVASAGLFIQLEIVRCSL